MLHGRWPRPPIVRGSDELQQVIVDLAEAIEPNPGRLIPDFISQLRASLQGLGWTQIGTIVRQNVAYQHLRAAVEHAERTANLELQIDEERAKASSSKDLLMAALLAPGLIDQASRASNSAVVLAVASLEAFINQAAKEFVDAWGEDEDRMPLRSKWLVVPRLMTGKSIFSRGAQPYQDFSRLVTLRNELVHSKPSERVYEGDSGFLRSVIDMRSQERQLDGGRWSCKVAREMVVQFARGTETEIPDWVSYVPPSPPEDLDAWAKAVVLTGTREDPDVPRVGLRK